eukprot:scpid38514/ scgid33188/ 
MTDSTRRGTTLGAGHPLIAETSAKRKRHDDSAATAEPADFSHHTPTCVSSSTPGSSPLPDVELERYVLWCVDRLLTSEKIISEDRLKVDKWQAQLEGRVYEDFLVKKYSKLSEQARLIECSVYAQDCVINCQAKIKRADECIVEARANLDQLVSELCEDKHMSLFSSSIMYRYDFLLGLKKASALARSIRASLTRAKAKETTVQVIGMDVAPPTAEEIGQLVKREVQSAFRKTQPKSKQQQQKQK